MSKWDHWLDDKEEESFERILKPKRFDDEENREVTKKKPKKHKEKSREVELKKSNGEL